MAFDATQPAAGTFCQDINGKLRDNFAAIQKGDHYTSATEPSYKEEGCPWYDTANNVMKFYNGSSWDTVQFSSAFDSGWFEIGTNTSYTKDHNLGTTKAIVLIYISDQSDGLGLCTLAARGEYTVTEYCTEMVKLSTTQIEIRTGTSGVHYGHVLSGSAADYTMASGWARIIMLALP